MTVQSGEAVVDRCGTTHTDERKRQGEAEERRTGRRYRFIMKRA